MSPAMLNKIPRGLGIALVFIIGLWYALSPVSRMGAGVVALVALWGCYLCGQSWWHHEVTFKRREKRWLYLIGMGGFFLFSSALFEFSLIWVWPEMYELPIHIMTLIAGVYCFVASYFGYSLASESARQE